VINSAGVAVEYYAVGITAALTRAKYRRDDRDDHPPLRRLVRLFEGAKIPILHVISSEGGHAL
jgi:hypothetical protein